jgi:hypothetical protein
LQSASYAAEIATQLANTAVVGKPESAQAASGLEITGSGTDVAAQAT